MAMSSGWKQHDQRNRHQEKTGGKGGGAKTTTRTYSYSATFAVGPVQADCRRSPDLGRPDLIYDAGSSDPATITASNQAASGFAIYTGTDTQSPDARIQATLGVANTPAWRGRAYIVFYDLQLARYGNSLMGAQVRVEVLTPGRYNYTLRHDDAAERVELSVASLAGTVRFLRCGSQGTQSYCLPPPDGVTWTKYALPQTMRRLGDVAEWRGDFRCSHGGLQLHSSFRTESPGRRFRGHSSRISQLDGRIRWHMGGREILLRRGTA